MMHARMPMAVAILLVFSIWSCKPKEEPPTPPNLDSFAAVINEAGGFQPVQETEVIKDTSSATEVRPDGSTWICETKTVSVTKGAGGNDGFPLFNPTASVIYPGSMLQGNSLGNATPDLITVERAGGTIAINILNGSPEPAFTVDKVTYSSITTASNTILDRNKGVLPANFSFSYESVQSRQQFAMSLGLDVSSAFVEFESKMKFSKDREYNRYFVSLTQQYYTMSFDPPTSYDKLFDPSVTPEDLAKYVGPGNPATYISDVTYGRLFYMLIESTSSTTKMEGAVSASFNGVIASGSVELDASSLSELDNLRVKVFALGGDAQTTLTTIGKTDLNELVNLLAESTDILTGVPLSYVVKSAYDNKIVAVKIATEYDVKECYPQATNLPQPMLWFDAAEAVTADDGYIIYGEGDDSYNLMNNPADQQGTVVSMIPDKSGNGFDAVAPNRDARPLFRENVVNGKPAFEVIRSTAFAQTPPETFLQYDGSRFIDSDYTIFVVMATPDRVLIKEKVGTNIVPRINTNNQPAYFMYSPGPANSSYSNLFAGFGNTSTASFGHTSHRADGAAQTSEEFRVFTYRYSKNEGFKIYIDGELVATQSDNKAALETYPSARIGGGYHQSHSRFQIAEIRAYDVAASEQVILQEKAVLALKYGL